MTFAVYLPPQARNGKVPCLWYLSGLTCTHENAMTKAGCQAHAAKHGVALVFPDTSPRGDDVPDDEAYDLGQGAGFYVDATEAPWAEHFQMETYIAKELQDLVVNDFPVEAGRQGILGHSMGGHGAITLAVKYPDTYRSLSAFAPIANPTGTDWGRKQLTAYLGDNEDNWRAHDASLRIAEGSWDRDLLVDQGDGDEFLSLLQPEKLADAIAKAGVDGTVRLQPGYDHSYYFVSTFIPDHFAWHAEKLASGCRGLHARS